MLFCNYVYTVLCVLRNGVVCGLGCYPNFKKAYERIETAAKTISKCDILVDVSKDNNFLSFEFEAIKRKKLGRMTYFTSEKYIILKSFMEVFPSDKLIPLDMVCEMVDALEEEDFKYRQPIDFM